MSTTTLQYRRLDELCDFYAGATLPTGSDYTGQQDGHLLLKVGDMNLSGNEKFINATREWTLQLPNSATLAPADSIVFPKRGGAIGTNKKRLLRREAILDPNMMGVRARNGLDTRYLYHWFLQFDLMLISNGSTVPQLNKKDLAPLKIPLPPLSEQKRIADILDKADAIRRKRQEAVELVQSKLLKSTFREHLGDPRTNPRGWPVVQLGEAINFVGGSQPPKTTFINERRPGYVRLVQIRDFKTDKYPTYIPKELAKRPFEKDDVMIARYGPPVFQILRGLEGTYNVALMKAENTECTTKDFIFYLLQLPEIHDVVVANSQRTAGQSGTNLTLLKSLEIPIPPIEKQNAITKILKSIETYHIKAESYSKAADDLFNVLVQRAFKGSL